MKQIKRFFRLSYRERSGVLWLAAFLVGLLFLRRELKSEPVVPVLDRAAMERIQQQVDSVRSIRMERSNRIYPFNPNYMTDYRAYVLGIPTAAYDRLQAYRKKGKWIHSAADFGRVTGIGDSLLNALSPFFRFPDWVKDRRRGRRTASGKPELPYAQKKDLNAADTSQLRQVFGVGKVLSQRIVDLRERLGGFSEVNQLYAVYGLSDSAISRIQRRFAVKEPVPISKMNVNEATASDLSTIPGISFEMGRKIWEFVRLREGIRELSDLEKVDGLSFRQLRLIAVYLYVE